LRDIGAERRGSTCIECEDWLPYLRVARAPFIMAGVATRLVHELKYGGWREAAEEMGEAMAAEHLPAAVAAEIAAVLPVPLSRTRLRERGFNQAELLAAVVSRSRGWPLATDLLIRRRHTARQASLAGGARTANVTMAFAVEDAARDIRDAHLLLVDDVLTTAATAQDCVRALCSAGARAVSVLTFARARPELPRADV
jgi:ComF family protein